MWNTLQLENFQVHVIPLNDLKVHRESENCFCLPAISADGIVVHNSLDGREFFEVDKSVNKEIVSNRN